MFKANYHIPARKLFTEKVTFTLVTWKYEQPLFCYHFVWKIKALRVLWVLLAALTIQPGSEDAIF